ncbi:DoxX family protein [Actinophytocola oryzae]|uniref:Putative membrane protein YkgB n=1 Tax=Actinophytocola oryzae TaxID=502181 RepID=A0A4R7W7A4_9PSEU|nr:DoxX family protein [Actinophytocola oryzae]TDV57929.1 putative membrane protein YkgB [Actinophytocola oryzae]
MTVNGIETSDGTATPTVRHRVAAPRSSAAVHWLLDHSAPILRVTVGVVFVWFGALKITGYSPVNDLVAATVPFLPASWLVPALGVFEVLAGTALVTGIRVGLVTALTTLHLLGTFLVLAIRPEASFRNGNPLLLTTQGEFVVKNLVLVAAGFVIAQHHRRRTG